jgi:tetratricopeptide (TPR) repeat protein
MRLCASCWKLHQVVVVLYLCSDTVVAFLSPFRVKESHDYADETYRKFRQRFFDKQANDDEQPWSSNAGSVVVPTQLRSKQVKVSHKDLLKPGFGNWLSTADTGSAAKFLNAHSESTQGTQIELIVSVHTDSCRVSFDGNYPQSTTPAPERQHAFQPFEPDARAVDLTLPADGGITELTDVSHTVITPKASSPQLPREYTTENMSSSVAEVSKNNGALPAHNGPSAPAPPAVHATQESQAIPNGFGDSATFPYVAVFCFILGVVCTTIYAQVAEYYEKWAAERVPRYIMHLEQRTIQLLQAAEYEQVRSLLERELPHVVRLRGENHVDCAAFRHFLAKALLAMGQYGDAEQLMQKVVRCYEAFGEDAYMAHALEDLGLAQQKCVGKEDAAQHTLQHALRIFVEEANAAAATKLPRVSRRLYGEDRTESMGSSLSSPAGSTHRDVQAHNDAVSVLSACSAPHSPVVHLRSAVSSSSPASQRRKASRHDSHLSVPGMESCSEPSILGRGRSDTNSSGGHTQTHVYPDDASPLDDDSVGTAEHTPRRKAARLGARLEAKIASLGAGVLPVDCEEIASELGPVPMTLSVVSAKAECEPPMTPATAGKADAAERALWEAVDELEHLLMDTPLTASSLLLNQQLHQHCLGGVDGVGFGSGTGGLRVTPAKHTASPAAHQEACTTAGYTPCAVSVVQHALTQCVVDVWYPACPHVARLLQRLAALDSVRDTERSTPSAATLQYLLAARQVTADLHGEDSKQVRAVDAEIEQERSKQASQELFSRVTSQVITPDGECDQELVLMKASPVKAAYNEQDCSFYTPS